MSLLGDKLGVLLFQLPPGLKSDGELLSSFLEQLPDTTRYAFEFRNSDWFQLDIYHLLEKHNCAFCIYEIEGLMSPMETTADFVYVRLHGPGNKYQGSYSEENLMEWAQRCKKWSTEKDVFVYFDNDEKGYAAFNAMRLKELVGENLNT